jgi:two-component system sensor histidine kinase and response regulator WspE
LLRNALDHGIESPDERARAGKKAAGTIRLEAYHHAGALQVVVSDDGRGIDIERVRAAVTRKGLASEETAARLSESELLEFLFLPGFS